MQQWKQLQQHIQQLLLSSCFLLDLFVLALGEHSTKSYVNRRSEGETSTKKCGDEQDLGKLSTGLNEALSVKIAGEDLAHTKRS